MRLRPDEIAAIKAAATEAFGSTAVVRLFGSRVDDSKRGGDIDLLVEVDGDEPGYRSRSFFLDLVEFATEEKKIDLVFIARGRTMTSFSRMVFDEAVLL